jgi:mono/diheme cytochrome c family protein
MLTGTPLRLSRSLPIAALALALFPAGCATSSGTSAAETAPVKSEGPAKPATVEEQIALGGKAYGQYCAGCHSDAGQGTDKAPAVVGANALPLDPPASRKARKAQFHTAMDVAQFVVTAMPPAPRPKPSETEYWAILAFDLHANGVTPKQVVGPDNAASIVIHP